jgi:hypothetical protein
LHAWPPRRIGGYVLYDLPYLSCLLAGAEIARDETHARESGGAAMRILLTGGAGYVGSACLRWLLRHGHDPIAFDDLSEGNAAAVPEGRLVVGDILDCAALRNAMQEHRIEAVMHFAALASVPDSIRQPERYWQVNVLGTQNVLDAMVACGIKRLIFSSTAATFAFDNPMPLTEDSRVSPQVPYGTTKLAGEWLINDYSKAHGIGYTILRYFNAAGADPGGEFGEDRGQESHLRSPWSSTRPSAAGPLSRSTGRTGTRATAAACAISCTPMTSARPTSLPSNNWSPAPGASSTSGRARV